jgi:hypothetical protein
MIQAAAIPWNLQQPLKHHFHWLFASAVADLISPVATK